MINIDFERFVNGVLRVLQGAALTAILLVLSAYVFL
jgi:hypothetical protein